MADLAMYIDTTKCTGCRGCQVACKQWNGLPTVTTGFSGSYENPPRIGGDTWTKIRFFEKEENGRPGFLFRKAQCMHCTDASCLAVCAAGAVLRNSRGVVSIDQDRCTGCKNCVVACPFHAVGFSKETGTSRKCGMCYDRVENGMEPACMKACPADAVKVGDREQVLTEAKEKAGVLKSKGINAQVYGEKELSGLHVIYLLDDKAETYGLPNEPQMATANIISNWLTALAGAAVLAIAPFWLIFGSRDNGITKSPGTGVDKNA